VWWAFILPNIGFLGLSVLELCWATGQTDRQIDRQTDTYFRMPPLKRSTLLCLRPRREGLLPYGGGGIIKRRALNQAHIAKGRLQQSTAEIVMRSDATEGCVIRRICWWTISWRKPTWDKATWFEPLWKLECTHRVRTHAVLLLSVSPPSECEKTM